MADRYAGQDYPDRWDLPQVMDQGDDAFGVQGIPPGALFGGMGLPQMPVMPAMDMPGAGALGPILPIAGALAGYLAGSAPRGNVNDLFQGYALLQRHLENQGRVQGMLAQRADQERLARMRTFGSLLPKMDAEGLRQVQPFAEQLGMGPLVNAMTPGAARAEQERQLALNSMFGDGTTSQNGPVGDAAGPGGVPSQADLGPALPNKPELSFSTQVGGLRLGRRTPSPSEQNVTNQQVYDRQWRALVKDQMAQLDPAMTFEDRRRKAVQNLADAGYSVPQYDQSLMGTPDRARTSTASAIIENSVMQYLTNKSMQSLRAGTPFIFDPNEMGLLVDKQIKDFQLTPDESKQIKTTVALHLEESLLSGITGGQRNPTGQEVVQARMLATRAMGGIRPSEWSAQSSKDLLGQTPEGQRAANIGQIDVTTPQGLAQTEQRGQAMRLTEQSLGKLTPEGTAQGIDAQNQADALRQAGQADIQARVRNEKALSVAPPGAIDKAKTLDELFGDIYRANQIGQRLMNSVVRYAPGFLNSPLNRAMKFTGLQPQDAKLLDEYLQMIAKAFSEERLAKAGATLTPTELTEIRSWAPRADDNVAVALPNLRRGTGWLAQRLDRESAELSQYGRTEGVLKNILPMYYKFGRAQEEAPSAPAR